MFAYPETLVLIQRINALLFLCTTLLYLSFNIFKDLFYFLASLPIYPVRLGSAKVAIFSYSANLFQVFFQSSRVISSPKIIIPYIIADI